MESNYINGTEKTTIHFCLDIQSLKSQAVATESSLLVSKGAMIATGIVCPASVILNTLVLLAFYKKPSLRTQGNTAIAVMAINDVFKGGIGGGIFITKEVDYQTGKELNCGKLIALTMTLSIVSDMIVAGMNVEKLLALKYPYWHHVHVTRKRLLIGAFVVAAMGLTATVLRVFTTTGRVPIVILFTVSTLSTVISALLIWRVIFKRNRQIHTVQSQPSSSTTASNSQRKAAKMSTYIAVGLLFTNVIPLIFLTVIFTEHEARIAAEPFIQALTLLGCLINPLIYCLMNGEIRKTCRELIRCIG